MRKISPGRVAANGYDPLSERSHGVKLLTGGVVGVLFTLNWLMPHQTRRRLNINSYPIDRMVKVGGIDHVGVGTDLDGLTNPPGEISDVNSLYSLTQHPVSEGFRNKAIDRIWGRNVFRALRDRLRK